MPIDVNRIREDKGFDPEEVRRSEQARFRKTDTVGEAITADNEWRKEQYNLEQLRKNLGQVQKAITDKKKATKGQDPCSEELKEKDSIEA